jgi:hypothetical protein
MPGYMTPMPEASSLTPAWNPDSRLEDQNDYSPASASHVSNSGDQHNIRHPLLDSRLLSVPLRVIGTSGDINQKELTAHVQSIGGQLGLRRTFYKTSVPLDIESVKPKHPNPTRDNGLLVVIKGDHSGKYVRRIHHRYESKDGIATVILAVVDRVIGHGDHLTGEQLELDASHLCVCEESKDSKELNRTLMDELREEARKTQAK